MTAVVKQLNTYPYTDIYCFVIVNISVIYVCCFASVMRKQVNNHPHNSIYGPYRARSVLYLYTRFEVDSSIRSKIIRWVPQFDNWVTWPRPRPLWGRFMVHTQERSVLYVCTKFEADSLIHSKVIRVPKFRNGSRDPKPWPFCAWNVEFV